MCDAPNPPDEQEMDDEEPGIIEWMKDPSVNFAEWCPDCGNIKATPHHKSLCVDGNDEHLPPLPEWADPTDRCCQVCGRKKFVQLTKHHVHGRQERTHPQVILCNKCHRAVHGHGPMPERKHEQHRVRQLQDLLPDYAIG